MRHLDGVLLRGHESAVDEKLERRRDLCVPLGIELVKRHPAAHEARLLLARIGQPQQDPARRETLRLAQPRIGLLGKASDRAVHTARPLVRRAAHHPAVALAPLLEQRGRQQR